MAQAQLNFGHVGESVLPPPPDPPDGPAPFHYYVTDLWVVGGIVYVGRGDALEAVAIDARDPADPNPVICTFPTGPGTNLDVEDVLVEGNYLLLALEDLDGSPSGGVRAYDLGDATNPTCNPAPPPIAVANGVATRSLFVQSIGLDRYLFAAGTGPALSKGVYVFRITNPAAPQFVARWTQDGLNCDWTTQDGGVCSPDSMAIRPVGSRYLMTVNAVRDGVYIVDVTNPAAPTTIAHFLYTFRTVDGDGDTLSDPCDHIGDGTPVAAGNEYQNYTGFADILFVGGRYYVLTTDFYHCGGHLILWSLTDVLSLCPAGPPLCPVDSVPKIAEHWATKQIPLGASRVWIESPYAFAAWAEAGIRALDLRSVSAPAEIAFFDTLEPATDGCVENQIPPAQCTFDPANIANVVQNRGLWGNYGVFEDSCYLYLTDRGSPDNNAAPGFSGSNGRVEILRYTGPALIPELRLQKSPLVAGDLVASWGTVPFSGAYNLYRGDISAFRTPSHYNHSQIPSNPQVCDSIASSVPIYGQFVLGQLGTSHYYLVTSRNACTRVEGGYGFASDGSPRPQAVNPCP